MKVDLKENKRLFAILSIGIIAVAMVIILPSQLSATGYTQGSQGMNFAFDSVYWNNAWWDSSHHGTSPADPSAPSSLDFSSQLNLNPDSANAGMPALCGTFGTFYTDLNNQTGLNRNYTWQIQNGTDSTGNAIYEQYQMSRVECTMSFNIYLSGTGTEAGTPPIGGGGTPNWGGAQVYIHLQPNNFLFFQNNPEQVYFAPAYIGLTDNAVPALASSGGGTISTDQAKSLYQMQSTNPEAQGDVFGISYSRGNAVVQNLTENGLLSYQGQTLDPSIFRSDYYIHLTLNTFMAENNWGALYLTHSWAFPSYHYDLTMYMYVVGHWTVTIQPGETPTQVPHPVVAGSFNAWSFLGPLGNLFAGLTGVLSLGLLIVLVLCAAALIGLFIYMRRSSRGQKTTRASGVAGSRGAGGLTVWDYLLMAGIFVVFLVATPPPIDLSGIAIDVLYYVMMRKGSRA